MKVGLLPVKVGLLPASAGLSEQPRDFVGSAHRGERQHVIESYRSERASREKGGETEFNIHQPFVPQNHPQPTGMVSRAVPGKSIRVLHKPPIQSSIVVRGGGGRISEESNWQHLKQSVVNKTTTTIQTY